VKTKLSQTVRSTEYALKTCEKDRFFSIPGPHELPAGCKRELHTSVLSHAVRSIPQPRNSMAIKHGQRRKPCEFRPQEPGNQRSGGREELTCSSEGLRLSAARAALLLWFRTFLKKETPPQLYLGSRDPAPRKATGTRGTSRGRQAGRAAGVD